MTGSLYAHDHSFPRSLKRWCFYLLVLNAAFVTPMLLARAYGYDPQDADEIRYAYIGGTILAVLGASLMLYRFTRTAYLSLDATHLTMPHYLWPRVRLEDITAIYLNPRTPGVLLLGVHRQLPRNIHASALSPPVAADELAELVRAAVAGIDADKARALAHASSLDARSQALPWASIGLAMALLALHTLAWHSGSRFDDLDLLASGAYLHSLALQGDAPRVLTALLLHASIPHLLSNVATLLLLGATLEHALGPRVLLATFVTSGAIGIAGSGGLAPELIHVGASSGLFGLIGVLALLRIARPALLPSAMLAVPLWLLSAVLMLSLGILLPGMDWIAHLLGLLAGVTTGALLVRMHERSEEQGPRIAATKGQSRVVHVIALFTTVGLLLAMVDASRRLLSTGDGLRLATLQHLTSSQPNLDALNAIAWTTLVQRDEHGSMTGPFIRTFSAQPTLTASQRDTLAALHFAAGSVSAAADEQVVALLAATDLAPEIQGEMAARLAVYVQHANAQATRHSQRTAPGGGACNLLVEVALVRGEPRALHIRTLSAPHVESPLQRSQHPAQWVHAPSIRDCRPASGSWALDTDVWRAARDLLQTR